MQLRCLASLILVSLLAPQTIEGYETDQFHNRLEPIRDSTIALNRQVNQTIEDTVAHWSGPRDDSKFVDEIFHAIGGYHWVDKIEKWAMKSDEVDRLSTPRRDSIYSDQPIWATRFIGLFGVGPTIKLNGQLIGSDKLGHFLSQGRKFYFRFQKYSDEARAAEQSAYTERAIFGQLTTGVYSNADLVANYEGYRFYRSLFEDNIIAGKPAIVRWENGGWQIQRSFTWADHVNAYWDEALNVNHFDGLLYPHMKERLSGFCDDFEEKPDMYRISNEAALIERYQHLQLRDTSELRLDTL
ncbi:MAG: hypothetical protein R3330_18070, partial [Saprospiraceae bacterium]|nr:hypothetical protein [Saprospiraceae bacterium]